MDKYSGEPRFADAGKMTLEIAKGIPELVAQQQSAIQNATQPEVLRIVPGQ